MNITTIASLMKSEKVLDRASVLINRLGLVPSTVLREEKDMLKNYQEMLEYAFDVLNRVYFNGELPPIVICIMSSKRTYGHYTINKEWHLKEER